MNSPLREACMPPAKETRCPSSAPGNARESQAGPRGIRRCAASEKTLIITNMPTQTSAEYRHHDAARSGGAIAFPARKWPRWISDLVQSESENYQDNQERSQMRSKSQIAIWDEKEVRSRTAIR